MSKVLPSFLMAALLAGCGNPYLATIRADLNRPETASDPDRSAVFDANLLSAVAAAKDGVDYNGFRIALVEEGEGRVIVYGENAEWLMGAKSIRRAIGVAVRPEGNKSRILLSCYKDEVSKEVLHDVIRFIKKTAVGAGMDAPAAAASPAPAEAPEVAAKPAEAKEPPVLPGTPSPAPADGKPLAESSAGMNIAVNDFRADGGSASDASVCSMLLRSALVKTGAFNVVEKERMSAILEEQATQQTGCTMQECAVKLGKLLNVRRFVVGNFGMLLGNYFLNIRVVDVESGRITFSESVKGTSADELRTGLENLAAKMAIGPI